MEELERLTQAVRAVAERAGASVVGIGAGAARGSGVVIDQDRILTNAHNLRGSPVVVRFADGRSAEGRVAGADLDGDLAVVEVGTGDAPPVAWPAAQEGPGLGSVVLALAHSGQGTRITVGLVSATDQRFRGPRGRLLRGAVEHTAPLAAGSSGGPLTDAAGDLVGVNTHRRGDGFYLALPAGDELRARVDALGRGEVPARPRLGVAVAPPAVSRQLRAAVGLPDREGLLVRGVDEAGPAGRADLRPGDLIVAAAGQALASSDQLSDLLEQHAGSTLALAVVRGSEELEVHVELEEVRA